MANLRDRLKDRRVELRILEMLIEDIKDTAADEAEEYLKQMDDEELQQFLDLVDGESGDAEDEHGDGSPS